LHWRTDSQMSLFLPSGRILGGGALRESYYERLGVLLIASGGLHPGVRFGIQTASPFGEDAPFAKASEIKSRL
jgi:hypothetical protein